MIKKTLYFSNPVYLSKKNDQLTITFPEKKEVDKYIQRGNQNSIPIEEIGIVILDNQQITITHGLLSALLENNTAVITTAFNHLPNGLFLPLESNIVQSERFREQINASEPLKKQLWQQTVSAKILNQAQLLGKRKKSNDNLKRWARNIKSGDPENLEGRAAVYYWKNIFNPDLNFERDPEGLPPNNLLNYGYAILRGVIARSLVGSGLLPTLGIHHHNKYNAYCLADDIMEPYRPYVDEIVCQTMDEESDYTILNPSLKKKLLCITVVDVKIEGKISPLMIGAQRTTFSLAECFAGNSRKISYPVM